MVAKSGDHLLERAAVNERRESLLPLASMITPNLPEAGVLLSASPVETSKEMRRTAEKLRRLLPDSAARLDLKSVVLGQCVSVLVDLLGPRFFNIYFSLLFLFFFLFFFFLLFFFLFFFFFF